MKWIVARTFPEDRDRKLYLERPEARSAGHAGRRVWVVLPKFAYKFDTEEEAIDMADRWCAHVETYDDEQEGA